MCCFAGSLRGRKGLGFRIDFCLLEQMVGGNAECGFCSIDWRSLDEKAAQRDPGPGCYGIFPIRADGIPANRLGRCTVLYRSTRVSPFNMYEYLSTVPVQYGILTIRNF